MMKKGLAEKLDRKQAIRKFIIELLTMLGIAFVISILVGLCCGKVNWIISGIMVGFAVLLTCVSHLASRPEKFSPQKLEKMSALAEEERLKLVKKLGWHWEARDTALCRTDNKTGETLESVDRRMLTEVWGINTDQGPFVEDLWFLCICGEQEISVASELLTPKIQDWFFALPGFDHNAFRGCMCCTDNRKTLLWRRSPLSFTWSDAWVLTSLLLSGEKTVTLVALMAVADGINHAILMTGEVNHALSLLCANGYLEVDGTISLTDRVEAVKDKWYRKARTFDKIGIVHQHLVQYATAPCPEIKEYFTDDDMKNAYREYTGK